MLDEKNRTLRAHPSLLPLRMTLIAAESGVPSRPRHADSNERLATQLIARVQSRYRKADPFLGLREHIQEMAGGYAQ